MCLLLCIWISRARILCIWYKQAELAQSIVFNVILFCQPTRPAALRFNSILARETPLVGTGWDDGEIKACKKGSNISIFAIMPPSATSFEIAQQLNARLVQKLEAEFLYPGAPRPSSSTHSNGCCRSTTFGQQSLHCAVRATQGRSGRQMFPDTGK